MKTNKELVIEFAKTWNNLDTSYIRELLIDDFKYASQWVFSEIENKTDYLSYLDGKLLAIANSDSSVVAELGIYNTNYCLVLTQNQNGINQQVTFLIETKDGKIVRADTCMIPGTERIKKTGIMPK